MWRARPMNLSGRLESAAPSATNLNAPISTKPSGPSRDSFGGASVNGRIALASTIAKLEGILLDVDPFQTPLRVFGGSEDVKRIVLINGQNHNLPNC